MKNLFENSRICKVCALVAATMVLPALAYAEDRDGRDQDNEHRWSHHDTDRDRHKQVSVVPEVNAGWVLIPLFGAVLLFSSWPVLGAVRAKK